MRIQYNSPVILTFSLICTVVLILSSLLGEGFQSLFVAFPSMPLDSPLTFVRLFTHVLGHQNWQHWIGNASIILLVGPVIEEKYGHKNLIMMILFTAFITGIIHVSFFSSGLLGASGIAFMLILLSSFTNMESGKIPLTFILVAAIYIGSEVISSGKSMTGIEPDNVAHFVHIIGGVCGAGFGFWLGKGKSTK